MANRASPSDKCDCLAWQQSRSVLTHHCQPSSQGHKRHKRIARLIFLFTREKSLSVICQSRLTNCVGCVNGRLCKSPIANGQISIWYANRNCQICQRLMLSRGRCVHIIERASSNSRRVDNLCGLRMLSVLPSPSSCCGGTLRSNDRGSHIT